MNDRIFQRAIVIKEIKGGVFRCHLQDNPGHEIIAYPSGKMRIRRITLCVGDEVNVELSPYDLHRGRIIWRHNVL